MIKYLFVFLIIFYICFTLFIRVNYPFWSIQPVFHFYDIYYWFFNIGIIRKTLPIKNKYVNNNEITTQIFDENIFNKDKQWIKQILYLIQLHYLKNNENKYFPTLDNILPYFKGHNSKSFWSLYWKPENIINKNNIIITEKEIIGIITSRPLHVILNNNNFDVYYVDYLCVNKLHRKQGIAPQLIQTHEYIQCHKNVDISISLFKREEELTGIIPLTIYKTYCFDMKKMHIPKSFIGNMKLCSGDTQNIYYFYNFIKEHQSQWKIIIFPEISNIIELIVSKNVFIEMLIENGIVMCVYIFRKTCIFIEKNKEVLSCIASINTNACEDIFFQGFKQGLSSILKQNEKNNFVYLSIEDISHNNLIIKYLTNPIIVSPTAYFFYNFAHCPFVSNETLIIT